MKAVPSALCPEAFCTPSGSLEPAANASMGWAYGLIMNLGVTIRFPPEYKERPE
jgi:hypothetical protein